MEKPRPGARRVDQSPLIYYHLMRLNLGYDLPYLTTGKGTKRAIALPEEVLALSPELALPG